MNNDRRIKIPKEEHEFIRARALRGESKRGLAREYGVDKRLIDFIVNPDLLVHSKLLREKRGGWRRYYDKDRNTAAVRSWRRHKRSILTQATKDEPQK